MSGVPTSVHLGPLTFHLYGLGLAVATYVAYLYARRRLGRHGVDLSPFSRYVVVVLLGGLVGARAAHVATNWSLYSGHPGRWLGAVAGRTGQLRRARGRHPPGLYLQRRWWPDVSLLAFCDALVPAVVAGWALGRVLGPQFMVAGGGHLTHQWFGLHYAGQVGRRVPVPLIQGAEDATALGAARRRRATRPRRAGRAPDRRRRCSCGASCARSTSAFCSDSSPTAARSASRAPGWRSASRVPRSWSSSGYGAGEVPAEATAGGAVATAVTDHGRDDDRQGGQE